MSHLYREDDTFLGVLLLGVGAGLIAVYLAFPYFVFYLLPCLVLGLLAGFLWLKGCYRSKEERRYGRLAAIIPLTLMAAMLWLNYCSPQPRHLAHRTGAGRYQRLWVETLPDSWNETFNSFYAAWYALTPFPGRAARQGFDYESIEWIVAIALILGAPLGFFLLYGKDFSAARAVAKAKIDQRLRESDQRYWEKHGELERLRNAYEEKLYYVRLGTEAREQEIERLKLREKYLTEGKLKLPDGALGSLDLDCL